MNKTLKLEYPVRKGIEGDGKRIIELDFLRGIAIILVLFSHYPMFKVFKACWMGVDLFFVLSGFLVGGLLIREFNRRGTVSIKRFLVRRGLKIYPAFYTYIFVTVALTLLVRSFGIPLFGIEITWRTFLAEIFYVQNYITGIWGHNWTLGIEEHFYFLLAFLFLILRKYSWAVKAITWIVLIAIPLVFIFRVYFVPQDIYYGKTIPIMRTHFRIDSLLMGVLIACVYHNYRSVFDRIKLTYWVFGMMLSLVVIILWSSAYNLQAYETAKVGYTVLYVSFGVIMTGFLMIRERANAANWGQLFQKNILIRLTANIGVYSYSIYLWHAFVLEILYALVYVKNGGNIYLPFAWRYLGIYLVVSIGFGYLMSILIEYPFLRWRNKKFPSFSK
ncbi:MAG: acyltransferase [Bacteroidetes bacterium]|nr:acyltransferase [Bacteroidota bacterium]